MERDTFYKIPNTLLAVCVFSLLFFSPYVFSAEEKGGEVAKAVEEVKMSKETQAALVAAQDFIQQNNYQSAKQVLLDHLATNPEYKPEVLFLMLGHIFYSLQDFDNSAKYLKEGYEAYPNREDMLSNWATVVYESEKFDEAAALFEKASEEFPEEKADYLQKAAACYYQGENLIDAKRVFVKILNMQKEPDFKMYEMIFQLCQELGQKDEARKYLIQMMNLDPLNPNYWQLLANMYLEDEDYTAVTSALEIAYVIKKPEKRDLENLDGLYAYLNVPLRLAKSLQKRNDRNENDNKRLINAYLSALRVDKAASIIDEMNKNKKDADLLFQKGNIYYEARKNKDAMKALDECIALNPNKVEAYMLKGFVAWDLEDWDLAKECFRKAVTDKEHKRQATELIDVIESLEEAKAAMLEAKAERLELVVEE
jgi:tetratricopeptide (TPR) repeat protein